MSSSKKFIYKGTLLQVFIRVYGLEKQSVMLVFCGDSQKTSKIVKNHSAYTQCKLNLILLIPLSSV